MVRGDHKRAVMSGGGEHQHSALVSGYAGRTWELESWRGQPRLGSVRNALGGGGQANAVSSVESREAEHLLGNVKPDFQDAHKDLGSPEENTVSSVTLTWP